MRDQIQVGQKIGRDIKNFIFQENPLDIAGNKFLPNILNHLLKRQLLSLPDYEDILQGFLENFFNLKEIQTCVITTLSGVIF